MNAASAIAINHAKMGTARSCGRDRKGLRLNSSVMQISRDLWPVKTSQYLADLTGYSIRSCEYWLSGKVVIPSDALAMLLQSEQGREFLVAVMADRTPRWWLRLKAWLSAIDLAAEQIKHRRKLRKLLDDAAPTPTPAMLLQDEDFYSGQPAPARTPAAPTVRGRR